MTYQTKVPPELLEKVRSFYWGLDSAYGHQLEPLDRLALEKSFYKRGIALAKLVDAVGGDHHG